MNIEDKINEAAAFCDMLEERYYIDNQDTIIFLFSDDFEINELTIKFLNVYSVKKSIRHFVLVTDKGYLENVAKQELKIPFKFVVCDKNIVNKIYCYCKISRRYGKRTRNIIINGPFIDDDKNIKEIIGYNGIDKKDIVSYCVFRMDESCWQNQTEVQGELVEYTYKNIDWKEKEKYLPKAVFGYGTASKESISDILNSEIIKKNDKIIIFSVTKISGEIIKAMQGYDIVAVLDNDPNKRGQLHEGVRVYKPEEILRDSSYSDCKIIVPTASYRSICEQLYYYGFEIGRQVIVTYRDVSDKRLIEFALEGKRIYENIRQKYNDEIMYICPYPGTGDIYLAGMYLQDRMKYDGVDTCIVVVPYKVDEKVLRVCGVYKYAKEIIVLEKQEYVEFLISYIMLLGNKNANAHVMLMSYGIVNFHNLSGVKNLDFNTFYQKVEYMAPEKRKSAEMQIDNADDIFIDNNLQKGRTVLVSPYANSGSNLDNEIFEGIVNELIREGYSVCTNVSGDEKPVKNTIGIMIPYNKIIDFMNKAGFFIGVRSGLCDIISSSHSRKIVLYHKGDKAGIKSFFVHVSLRNMGLADDNLLELEVDSDDHNHVVEQLKAYIGQTES